MHTTSVQVDHDLDEKLNVLLWRIARLTNAGFDEDTAVDLALERDVDLHLAERLLEQGCPPATAVRILV